MAPELVRRLEKNPQSEQGKGKPGNNNTQSRSHPMKTLIEWHCWGHQQIVTVMTTVVRSLREGPRGSPPCRFHAFYHALAWSLCCSEWPTAFGTRDDWSLWRVGDRRCCGFSLDYLITLWNHSGCETWDIVCEDAQVAFWRGSPGEELKPPATWVALLGRSLGPHQAFNYTTAVLATGKLRMISTSSEGLRKTTVGKRL